MAVFKGKEISTTNLPKRELVVAGESVVAIIEGTLETDDKKLISILENLGYEQIDAPKEPVKVEPKGQEKKPGGK